jgi:hypothetical protein
LRQFCLAGAEAVLQPGKAREESGSENLHLCLSLPAKPGRNQEDFFGIAQSTGSEQRP